MATKAEQRERTRAEIVRIATRRFAEQGYAGVALEDLVAEAGLTRGALYHHFGSKEGLFRAVVERAQAEVADAVDVAASGDGDGDGDGAGDRGAGDGDREQLTDRFLAGCRAFLVASLAPEVRRILLVDGPAVLGWGGWREGDLQTSARLLAEGVEELAEAGVIETRGLAAVTSLLSGALNEVALANAEAPDPARGIDEAVDALRRMLSGLSPSRAT
ncbi:TetR/AcrR family transcriptional regulator [Agromyces sp. NPDC058110]|uniref:TetR/AcrR family transcriptional regulator n=1 Tax=Agromyces sp. NPDC058110 TaxID=3346345 RepID=UPI0036D76145